MAKALEPQTPITSGPEELGLADPFARLPCLLERVPTATAFPGGCGQAVPQPRAHYTLVGAPGLGAKGPSIFASSPSPDSSALEPVSDASQMARASPTPPGTQPWREEAALAEITRDQRVVKQLQGNKRRPRWVPQRLSFWSAPPAPGGPLPPPAETIKQRLKSQEMSNSLPLEFINCPHPSLETWLWAGRDGGHAGEGQPRGHPLCAA